MTKTPINLQDLRRRIYRKAKSEKEHRFWGIFVHVTKIEVLAEAYRRQRGMACPGIDGQTFEDVDASGVRRSSSRCGMILSRNLQTAAEPIRGDTQRRRQDPHASNPHTRDRVVQGIEVDLEAIFEADFVRTPMDFDRSDLRTERCGIRRSILGG